MEVINKTINDVIKLMNKTKEIAREVELMIIVGKKEDSMTNELYTMAIKGR